LETYLFGGYIKLALNFGAKKGRNSMRELTLEEIEVVVGGMPIIDL